MLGHGALVSLNLVCAGIVVLSAGCASTAPCTEARSAAPSVATPPATPAPVAASSSLKPAEAAPEASAKAPSTAETPSGGSMPPSPPSADPEPAALAAEAVGPATGGPRGTRPCAFHESVDTYQRQCVSKVNADGSVTVSAKGTPLNPNNGFEFTLHGGKDNRWIANGTLTAFKECTGPFVALATASFDHGVTSYELRFKQHCMIVVR